MKNLTKLFLAVSVALFSFACATDMTEDLGVNVGGKTVLSVSTPDADDTKTAISGKEGTAYKLVWSEGDQISVNGTVSEPLTNGGNGNASFEFEGVLDAPFNVLYPGNAEGKVTFPAVQNYLDGTFDLGSAPMYGYSADGNSIQMSHLAGVVRLAVTGNGIINSVVLTAEENNLAGTYTVNCETGELSNGENTSNAVTLNCNGLVVNDSENLYIAVPAGDHGKITVTVNMTTGKMTKSFTKEIEAGSVLEMKKLELNPSAGEGEIYIDSEAKLNELATNPTSYTKAIVTADIAMSEESEFKTIEGFAGEFDGGNYTISGLKAPLFGTTNATAIKNVNLDVDINFSGAFFGALACVMTNTEAVVSNCSVSGNILINNTSNPGSTIRYGALVGRGPKTHNCWENLTSYATVTVSGSGYTANLTYGGVLGDFTDNLYGNIKNVKNLGTTYMGTESNPISGSGMFLASNICMFARQMENCVNGDPNNKEAGRIFANTRISGEEPIYIAGLCRYIQGNTINCHNYADIVVKHEATGTGKSGAYIAGLFVANYFSTSLSNNTLYDMKDSSNHGNITVSGTVTDTTWTGGINSGYQSYGDVYFNNVHNYGDIEVGYASNSAILISGFCAGQINTANRMVPKFENCSNSGNILFSGSKTGTSNFYLGGFIAQYSNGAATFVGENKNTGNINVTGSIEASETCIGGFVGQLKKNLSNATAVCNIKTAPNNYAAGMLVGYGTSVTLSGCKIGGTINGVDITGSNYLNYVYNKAGVAVTANGVTYQAPTTNN